VKALTSVACCVCVGALLVACGPAPVDPDSHKYGTYPESFALENVISACDQFGNRVYKSVGGPGAAPIAVVGADPTCQEVSR
jgi:hypothetical protein